MQYRCCHLNDLNEIKGIYAKEGILMKIVEGSHRIEYLNG